MIHVVQEQRKEKMCLEKSDSTFTEKMPEVGYWWEVMIFIMQTSVMMNDNLMVLKLGIIGICMRSDNNLMLGLGYGVRVWNVIIINWAHNFEECKTWI